MVGSRDGTGQGKGGIGVVRVQGEGDLGVVGVRGSSNGWGQEVKGWLGPGDEGGIGLLGFRD